jgi:hypothetical protein
MAKQGGQGLLEQSDMRLVLNMAKMAKEDFSRATIEETKYLSKKHASSKPKVQQHSLPKWHPTGSRDLLDTERNRCTTSRSKQRADSRVDSISTLHSTRYNQ